MKQRQRNNAAESTRKCKDTGSDYIDERGSHMKTLGTSRTRSCVGTINKMLYMCQQMVLPVYFEGELRVSIDCGQLVTCSVTCYIFSCLARGLETRTKRG